MQRLAKLGRDKRFIAIVIVLIIGISLFMISQEYHPIIYTNIHQYELHSVNERENYSFLFSTDGTDTTVVNVTLPPHDSVRYSIVLNNSYTRNNLLVLSYSVIGQGLENHSFQFNESSSNPNHGSDYLLNITSANNNAFPVNVSSTIVIPNRAVANPIILISGIVLIVGAVVSMALFISVISRFKS